MQIDYDKAVIKALGVRCNLLGWSSTAGRSPLVITVSEGQELLKFLINQATVIQLTFEQESQILVAIQSNDRSEIETCITKFCATFYGCPVKLEAATCDYCDGSGFFYSEPDLGPCVCKQKEE